MLLLSAISLIVIVYQFPILSGSGGNIYLSNNFPLVRLLLFFSAALALFTILQFKNRSRQLLFSSIARFLITIAFFVIILNKDKQQYDLGTFLLFVPFFCMWLANFFIKRDEKLIKSADRLR